MVNDEIGNLERKLQICMNYICEELQSLEKHSNCSLNCSLDVS